MNIFEEIKKLVLGTPKRNRVMWKNDQYELDIIYPEEAVEDPLSFATNEKNSLFALQYAYINNLPKDIVKINRNGISIPVSEVPLLGEEFQLLFDLPKYFTGKYIANITGNTRQASFNISISLNMPDGAVVNHYQLSGCFLKLAENEQYSISPAEFNALNTLNEHKKQISPTEFDNNYLLFLLQQAKKAGMNIELAHFEKESIEIIKPDTVSVAVNMLENGDVELLPAINGVRTCDIKDRLGQIRDKNKNILKVNDKFILFTEERLKAIDEIFPVDELSGQRKIRHIEKSQVENFLKNPTAYLDAALVNLDTGFSLRVLGAEKFIHKYFGDIEKSGIDWFGERNVFTHSPEILQGLVKSESELEDLAELIDNAVCSGAEIINFAGENIDISDIDLVENTIKKIKRRLADPVVYDEDENVDNEHASDTAVVSIETNDEENQFERHIELLNDNLQINIEQGNLKRLPFPHQQEGIQWVLSHLITSLQQKIESGALLADDMGLGKTYMTLVSMAEYYYHCDKENKIKKPLLVVAPLSLLENWQDEIDETFKSLPFNDVILLQGNSLKPFRLGGREINQHFDEESILDSENIRYSLKIGNNYADQRLDMPGRLVLVTYQTLRDYQFSLCRVDWGMVVFDEAQNLKNPNALVTRAAKGLKSEFKLLATGTPVENSLRDFWCLMDTATPGLLGSWQNFRQTYIQPILSATPELSGDIKLKIGQQLREKVGLFMLRRTKAEKLKGLPEKVVYSGIKTEENYLPILNSQMTEIQLKKYDEIIDSVRSSTIEDKRELILSSLRSLKITSIHHNLDSIDENIIRQARQSCKIRSLLDLLEQIKMSNEKALIFAESKIVQTYLVALLIVKFGIQVEIINGETPAVATARNPKTRKSIIDEFQAKPGFGVLVMSPVAAGVGLTIVGANHVIHLERHWNPAKEAQATDRVYRIGQTRKVNVYLPIATHPNIDSFDVQLHHLLNNKTDLSNAIVAVSSIDAEKLSGLFK